MAADVPPVIIWEEVDKHLPIQQDPEHRQARKALFKKMLRKDHRLLSIDDVQKGMKTELRYDMAGSYVPGCHEMTKIIRYAFKSSADLGPRLSSSPSRGGRKGTRRSTHGKSLHGHAMDAKAKGKKEKPSEDPADSTALDPVDPKDVIQVSPAKDPSEEAPIVPATSSVSPCHATSRGAKGHKTLTAAEVKGFAIDFREFHAFLICLRHYLQWDELFEQLDGHHNENQKLSYRDIRKGEAKLAEWGITQAMLKEQFEGVDVWVAHMTFEDFLTWVMGVRMDAMHLKLDNSDDEEVQEEAAKYAVRTNVDVAFKELGAESDLNKIKVKETFDKWDADASGGLTVEEMGGVMKQLNPNFTDAKVALLFKAADINKDGLIDFEEFLQFVFA